MRLAFASSRIRMGTPSGVPPCTATSAVTLNGGASRRSEGPLYWVVAVGCLSFALTGCHNEHYDVVIHNRLVKIAGQAATDCGRATTNNEYPQQTACALGLLSKRAPFIVQYRIQGIDAISEDGYALDASGKLWSIDTFSWGPAAPVGKIEQAACDQQKLHSVGSGFLVCY